MLLLDSEVQNPGPARFIRRFATPSVVQVEIIGTATARLYGRLDEDASWVELITKSGNDVFIINATPLMYVDKTGAGEAKVWIR